VHALTLTSVTELPYRPNTAQLFAALHDLPYGVFLDSGHGSPYAGRFDILAADPHAVLATRGGQTEIWSQRGTAVSGDDPLELLESQLGRVESAPAELPFTGGAIGCFAYDLGRRFERLPELASRDIEFPDMLVGLYDWAFVVDHWQQASYLVGAGRDPTTRDRWAELERLGREPSRTLFAPFEVVSAVESNFTQSAYADAFAAVKDHIRRGDCYQVNLAQRFEARVKGDSWNAYLTLRSINPAPYSAYMRTPFGDILSSSPERFLKIDGGVVETKPIKGTRARAADAAVDALLREELAGSSKDRAENVMIVDLLRNDLGKSCIPGSVHVAKLFDIESFAHVHHMVSTVRGRLSPNLHALDLLRGCFPGGSITGAPKLRAMEIIDALEPERRSVYCGSIGYLDYAGRMDLNIAIRTLLRAGDSMFAWAGGGIVADSDCAAEYQESLDKADALLAVLADSRISAAS
jgi:para-aminobenzoate synthetase component 1